MPTARKLPSGSWRCQVLSHYEYIDGKKKRVYISFTSKDPTNYGKLEAEKAAAEFALKRENSQYGNGSLSFSDALDKYIEERSKILSPSSVRKYRRMKKTLDAYFNDYPLRNIKTDTLQNIINQMAAEYSAKTVRDLYGLITAVLKRFYPDKVIRITLPKKVPTERYIPSDNDIQTLIRTAAGTPMEIPVCLAAFGGLRRGEISALKVSDIQGNMIHVHATMVLDDDNKWITKAPKSFAGDRYVALPKFLIKLLRKKEDYVTELRPNMITSQFEHLLNQAGLPHFRFHDLRHYNASVQHALGIPDAFIMQSGGWGNDRVLKEVYRHAMPDRKARIENVAVSHFENLATRLATRNKKVPVK